MHPSKFFEEVHLRTGIDTFEIYDAELKEKLSQVHPLNFIKTKIVLPVYKVTIQYMTSNEKLKQAEKYMILDGAQTSQDDDEDFWADMYIRDYAKEHELNQAEVISVEKICDAVLPIG